MRLRLPAVVLVLVAAVLTSSTATAAPDVPARPAALWAAPLDPLTVGRPFESPPHFYGPGHRGADLAGVAGQAVLAAGDGTVVFAGMVAGRPVVSIDHANGLRTTYEPVAPAVAAGQKVTRGSPIGLLSPGHPGCGTETCLHWGLRQGETYLDPMALLRPPRIRLLPMD